MRREACRRMSALPLHALLLASATAIVAFPSSGRADSAVAAETASGNAFNPTGQIFPFPPDPLGLSTYYENSRSPSGLLYMRPLLTPEMVQSSSNPDWWSSAWGEAGYLGTAGNTGAATFRQYGDPTSGFLFSHAGVLAQ